MYVTREADYAVRCVLYLSRKPERVVSVNEISESMYVPRSFLAKILQHLARKGFIKSTRGVKGGFQLAKKPKDINLLEVIEAIQGLSAMNVCAIDRRVCNLSSTCPVHPIWVKIREDVRNRLRKKDFAKLTRRR